MAETANTPLVDASQEAQPLSPGEQLVWAAAYAQLIIAGNKPEDAARHATTYACSLRVIREQDVAARSGTCGPAATMAAVEQMQGGR